MTYATLGANIRLARETARMEQVELADRMGLRQQAVSGWERGISRPRRSDLPVLCSILELNLQDVLQVGAYEDERVTPTQNRLLNLPFENLSPEAFEAFCRDLLQMRYPRRTVVRNGSSGFKQHGVDIYIDGEGERIGVQCKRHANFGPRNVERAIEEVLPDAQLSSGAIALSRRSATPKALLKAKDSGWALWDGETLSGFVRGLQEPDKLALIESYFPGLREPFLGISEPSPWLEQSRFDAALPGRLGVDRNFPLVGRTKELRKLIGLAADHYGVVLVVGRGGIGKSRLLREFATSDVGRVVRFAVKGQIPPNAFDLLPDDGPVIVVDDATDAEYDVSALVNGIHRARPDATVVLATRPRALPKLRASLDLPERTANDVTVTVGDLSIEDAESLAREALGDHAKNGRAEALSRIGYDCPFLIVTGAHLVRSGRLNDADLSSQTVLRQEILARFTDLVLSGANADARTSVLQALASIQPAPLEDDDFIKCLIATSEQSQASLLEILDELEDLGLVLRRGKVARVVPDLLGDATLERALVSRSGLDKQFARRLADHARGSALSHAINNVSIVDWHRRADGDSNLAAVLWSALAEHTRDLPNSSRIALGKRVAVVAAIYPDRALNFAEGLMANPGPDEDDELSGIFGESRKVTSEDVARSLAPLLANAAQQIEFLPRALRHLLNIGLQDDRSENSNPNHALRLARELGEFHPRRHVAYTQRYVAVVGEILSNDEYPAHRGQIVSLLGSAFAQDVTLTDFKGGNVTISHLPIRLEAVTEVRSAAITIAEKTLNSDARTARATTAILKKALHSNDRTDPVTDEFAAVVNILSRVLSDPNQSAGLRLAAYRALGWHATYGQGPRRKLSRSVRKKLHVDDDVRFIRAIRADWHFDDEEDEVVDEGASRYHLSRARSEQNMEVLVERWTTQYTPDELVWRVQEALARERAASDDQILPDRLLTRIFEESPDAARLVVRDNASGVFDRALVRVGLLVLFGTKDPMAEKVAIEMIASGSEPAKLVAAAVLGSSEDLDQARRHVAGVLATTTYPEVHVSLLSAARWLESEDRELVLDMLKNAPIETQSTVAEAALGVLEGKAVPWESLSPGERAQLLDRLVMVPRLPAYELGKLLNKEIAVDPFAVLGFLQRRIQRRASEKSGNRDYEPLPHIKSMDLDFASSDSRTALIEAMVEWTLDDDSWERQSFGKDIFETMVAGYDPQIKLVILKLIRSCDAARLRLARDLLDEAPQDFVLREPEFVTEALEAAGGLNLELSNYVRWGLHGSAEYGTRSRSIGVDDPHEVALRDGAKLIAGRYSEGSTVRDFYLEVAERASRRIESERQDDLSLRDPRSWK